MAVKRAVRHICLLAAVLLLGGLAGATLVRFAPGFDVDERELDPRLSEASRQDLRRERAADRDILRYYGRYLSGMAQGDLGRSLSLGRPVRELLADRLPVTLRASVLGLLAGWGAGLSLAIPGLIKRRWLWDHLATAVAGTCLSLPAALIALALLFLNGPAWVALGIVVFPRVYRYARNILRNVALRPAVMQAQAAGLKEWRILLLYVLLPAAGELLALAGVTAGVAFSAAIPVEAICDVAGVGSLAWQAALSRDLPLLVNVTMLVTLIVLGANAVSDLAIAAWGRTRE